MVQEPLRWYSQHKILFWIISGLVVTYTLAGVVVAPLVIRHVLENGMSKYLQRRVQVANVRTNPFTYSVLLTGLTISERDGGPFLQVGDVLVNTAPVMSLFKWAIVVQSVEISSPQVRIIRTAAHSFNFSDLLTPPSKPSSNSARDESAPPRFVLGALRITGGNIHFKDKALDLPFESTVSSLEVTLSGLDTKPRAEAARVFLSARSESSESMQIQGQVTIQPFSLRSAININSLAAPKYAPYYQPFLNARVNGGRIDFHSQIHWSEERRIVEDLSLAVSDLKINDFSGRKALVDLPRFKLQSANIDLKARSIQLGRIAASNGVIHIRRNAAGQLDLPAAFSPPGAETPKPGKTQAPAPDDVNSPAWQIGVPELTLDGWTVEFQDNQPVPPVQARLHRISVKAKNLSSQARVRGQIDLSVQWADKGSLAARGDLGINPLQADLNLDARDMDVRPLQPYLGEFVNLVVTKGDFNASGQMKIAPAKTASAINFSGQASLNSFEAVDTDKAAIFSKWKSLYLTGIDLNTEPLKVNIAKIALTDFFNRMIINPDGSFNIENAMVPERRSAAFGNEAQVPASRPETGASGNKTASGDRNVEIGIKTVTLQGGTIDYSDLHIKPNVRLLMKNVGGHISGLDNIKSNRADVLLQGTVGGSQPMEIKGQINPLIQKPYVDLSLNFPGMDLTPFGPYSGKYIGYTLEKGQLALNLSYKVIDDKLTGQNKIELNQLTFGESVASPEATRLPVKLAVALLKDRQGDINLDLPVAGNLDDPQFSLGGIILKMFVNLINDIVSAPFKMLGAIFGGGEELSYLEFDPGQSAIPAQRAGKLDTLSKILYERPGLKLEIQGEADPQKDGDGLRRLRFEQSLKAARLKELVAAGGRALPLDQLELSPAERDRMIREAFDAASFPKPRDENGKLKAISLPEMEKLLYTAIQITPDDLRLLAYKRASAVKEHLLATGRVEAKRLFVVESVISDRRSRKNLKPQVQFRLE